MLPCSLVHSTSQGPACPAPMSCPVTRLCDALLTITTDPQQQDRHVTFNNSACLRRVTGGRGCLCPKPVHRKNSATRAICHSTRSFCLSSKMLPLELV